MRDEGPEIYSSGHVTRLERIIGIKSGLGGQFHYLGDMWREGGVKWSSRRGTKDLISLG